LTAIADFESRQEKEESLSSARRPEKGEESRKPGKDSRVKEASSTLFFLIGALVKRELRFTTKLESFFFFKGRSQQNKFKGDYLSKGLFIGLTKGLA
jgi:hypothetical protein